jgi:hypothetical protein
VGQERFSVRRIREFLRLTAEGFARSTVKECAYRARDAAPLFGGEGEIRTHESREGPPVFKTGAFNRSATSPTEPTLAVCEF